MRRTFSGARLFLLPSSVNAIFPFAFLCVLVLSPHLFHELASKLTPQPDREEHGNDPSSPVFRSLSGLTGP